MSTAKPTFAALEKLALQAHSSGQSWLKFWSTVAPDVDRLAGISLQARQRAYDHLLHLWATGDESGAEPPNSDPWEQDDQAEPLESMADTNNCSFSGHSAAMPSRCCNQASK